jgi:DNA-binding NarL/FixJ family response regulator
MERIKSASAEVVKGKVLVRLTMVLDPVRVSFQDFEAQFTAREKSVFEGIALGLQNKEIAAKLNLSLRTVKFHVSNLFAKTGVSNRYGLVALAKVK